MFHLVYRITNKINTKFYIGVHSTEELYDGYMGSGTYLRAAIKKYGVLNFTREILHFCDSREQALKIEADIVTTDVVSNVNCYNLRTGGVNGQLISKEREIFTRFEVDTILPPEKRFDKTIKYLFSVNEKGIHEWKSHFEKLKLTETKKRDYSLRIWATQGVIKIFPDIIRNIEKLYNNQKTNKTAKRLLSKIEQKNLYDCITITTQDWNPNIGNKLS